MVGGAVAVWATELDLPPVLAVVILGLLALACWDSRDRLAWCFGLLLPVDFVTAVPGEVFDVARYAAVLWLVLRFEPDLSPEGNRYLRHLAVLIGSLAVIRGSYSLVRNDRKAMVVAFIMAAALACAVLLGRRVAAHRHIVGGFLAGMCLTSVVAIMQALDVTTLREGNQEGVRFPGLASSTALLTWQLAFALIIAISFLVTPTTGERDRITAWAAIALCAVALVVCGAQGGLLGLAAAGVFALAAALRRRILSWHSARRFLLAGIAAVVVLTVVVVALGVQTPTIGGLNDSDHVNENARLQVAKDGFHEMLQHPVTGMGDTRFYDRYGISPHFLPIDFGVTAGLLGFAVAAYLLGWVLSIALRGPARPTPSAWLGFALVSAISANTLTEAGVPFAGLSRVTLLAIAILASRGEPWPAGPEPEPEPAATRPHPAQEPTHPRT